MYAEVNGGAALAAGWRYFWRGGYLAAPGNAATNRAEGRFGIATGLDGWQLQLSLDAARLRRQASSPGYGSSAGSASSKLHGKLVLGLARSF